MDGIQKDDLKEFRDGSWRVVVTAARSCQDETWDNLVAEDCAHERARPQSIFHKRCDVNYTHKTSVRKWVSASSTSSRGGTRSPEIESEDNSADSIDDTSESPPKRRAISSKIAKTDITELVHYLPEER